MTQEGGHLPAKYLSFLAETVWKEFDSGIDRA
jgi:hypothetical protein